MRGWMLVVALLGCAKPAPEENASAPARADEAATVQVTEANAQALARADEAATTLGRTLKARLQAELPKGVEQAMAVCAGEAQAMGAKVAAEQQAKVGRSSLRLRNPKNEAPSWVRDWLEVQGERKAEGAAGFARLDMTHAGPVARVLKPIAVEAPCVLCHGAPESLAVEVKAVLAEKYPQDRATGYQVGDLRGALWAETPVAK